MIRKQYCRFMHSSLSKQSPIDRISLNKIITNVQSHRLTHQLMNNIQIAINCTKIAAKYSKCYLCRVPFIQSQIRKRYNMDHQDQRLSEIRKMYLSQNPLKKYQLLFDQFYYENKRLYAALSMIMAPQHLSRVQQDQMNKFMTALELVNLGFSLHHSVGKSYRLNTATRLGLKLMSKQMKDSYLVLGGDYFHIRGSVLASETNSITLSKLLSEVEIDLCKYVHLTESLKEKINSQGYKSVQVSEIFAISSLKTSSFVKGMEAVESIVGSSTVDKESLKQVYECLGLMILYRKELQHFMFNFKDIVKKYVEYSSNKVSFNYEESLPYYIFFKGAQDSRIDTSYLNTVAMMSEQIDYLKEKVCKILGPEQTDNLDKKMNYLMMIYS